MRYSLPHKSTHAASAGFTLIEMLIIAPIVILALGGFITVMVTMVGDVIAARDESVMMYETQDALNRIEDDISLSTSFLTTSGALLAPQGSNDNTAAFTNDDGTLIMNTMVTDRSPLDSLREIIYYKNQPNPCDATKTFNKVLYANVIYFVKNGSLWRRTAIAPYNTNATPDAETVCSNPWQQNSCSPGYTSTRCATNDVEIMKNITSLNVEYYSSASGSTDVGAANAASADTIKVAINGQKQSAGHDVETAQSLRTTRLNPSIVPPPAPALAISQQPANKSVIHTDTNVQFTVAPNYSTATVQWQRSTNSGATWANISGATSNTYTLATVSLGINGYQYRAIATKGTETATSDAATLAVTIWGDIDFNAGFSNYLGTYSPIGYTRTTSGVVMLKGLIKKSSAIAAGDVIGTLPLGSRPSGILLFQTSTSPNAASRIDIYPNGDVRVQTGNAAWVSLEGINFIPAGTSYTRNTLTLANSWANYGGSFSPATYVLDSLGRTHVEGLVRNGTITNGTQIVSNLPSPSGRTDKYMHLPASSPGFGEIGIDQNTGIVAKNKGTNGYMSLNSFYYPASLSASWTNLTLQNGWVSYDGGSFFTLPQYTKGSDGIVRLRGLIKSGTTTNGTNLTTLPVGYRPKDRTLLGSVCVDVYCRVDVRPDGVVELHGASSTWTSLDSVTFLAEQ